MVEPPPQDADDTAWVMVADAIQPDPTSDNHCESDDPVKKVSPPTDVLQPKPETSTTSAASLTAGGDRDIPIPSKRAGGSSSGNRTENDAQMANTTRCWFADFQVETGVTSRTSAENSYSFVFVKVMLFVSF